MKLEEMTNAQLVNIIFRKDDVEVQLRKEIEALKRENKRLAKVKQSRTIAICFVVAALCIASLVLLL